uniref:Uncharacterized protein n=1 Tax=Romanomermis culicivorax TaxID=13658 RepID=A0A915KCL6_ROMCU
MREFCKKLTFRIYPSLYYAIRYRTSDNIDVDFVVIDTIVLCGHTLDGLMDKIQNFIFSSSSAPDGSVDKIEAEKQWSWIENQLKNSKYEKIS